MHPTLRPTSTPNVSASSAARVPESCSISVATTIKTRESVALSLMALDPETSNPRIALPIIEALIGRGEFRSAQATLTKFMKMNPDNSDLIFQNARLLKAENECMAAKSLLADVLEINPYHIPSWALMLQIYLRESTKYFAISYVEAFFPDEKDRWFADMMLAYIEVLSGNKNPNKNVINDKLDSEESSFISHIVLGWNQPINNLYWNNVFNNHLQSKQLLPLENSFDAFVSPIINGKILEVLTWIENRLIESPGNIDLLLLKAILLIKCQNYSEAAPTLQQLLDQGTHDLLKRPFFTGSDRMVEWVTLFLQTEIKSVPYSLIEQFADIFLNFNEPTYSAYIYKEKRNRYPDDFSICASHGLNIAQNGCYSDFAKVEEILTRALSLTQNPSARGFVHGVFGRAYYNFRMFDSALTELEHASECEVFNIVKIKCLIGLDNYVGALALVEKAIKSNPTNPYLWSLKGRIHSETLEPVLSMEAYKEAVKLNPTCVKLRFKLATERTYIEESDKYSSQEVENFRTLALEDLNLFLQQHPYNIAALQKKATTLSDLRDHEQALETIDQAINLAHKKASLYRIKAMIAEHASNHAEVIDAVNEFKNIKNLNNDPFLVFFYTHSAKRLNLHKEALDLLNSVEFITSENEIKRIICLIEIYKYLYSRNNLYFNDFKEAIEKGLKLDPENIEILTHKIDLFLHRYSNYKDYYQECLEAVNIFLSLEPNNDIILKKRILLKISENDTAGAIQDLFAFKNLFPEEGDFIEDILPFFKTHFEDSPGFISLYVDFINKLVEAFPFHEILRLTRINLRLESNEYIGACIDLKEYLMLRPGNDQCQTLLEWTKSVITTRKLNFNQTLRENIDECSMGENSDVAFQRIRVTRSLLLPAWKLIRNQKKHPDRTFFLTHPDAFSMMHFHQLSQDKKRVLFSNKTVNPTIWDYEKRVGLLEDPSLKETSPVDDLSLYQNETSYLIKFVESNHIDAALASLYIMTKIHNRLEKSLGLPLELTLKAKNPSSLTLLDLYSVYQKLIQGSPHASRA